MSGMSEFLEQYNFLSDDLTAVREQINRNLMTGHAGLDRMFVRFLDSPGKMLRPLMVMLAARFGKDFNAERMHRLAAAMEILHIATLVHDDIIDESPLRRGVPTIQTTDGVKKAVLAGDYLFTRCFRLVADFSSTETSSLFASAVGRICESEMAQARDTGLSLRWYRRKITGKTALLFLLSLSSGATESEADPALVQNLRAAGYGIGMSFQIVDDILDYTSAVRHLGKPTGNDTGSGLVTLPLIMAAESGDPRVLRLYGRRKGGRFHSRRMREAVITAGGVESARREAEYYTALAEKSLRRLPDIPARQALLDLTGTVLLRDR